jgi:hypothetical protein
MKILLFNDEFNKLSIDVSLDNFELIDNCFINVNLYYKLITKRLWKIKY